MRCVLDASALVAYLRGEPGALVVQNLLLDPNISCFAHSINLCEVYYQSARQSNAATAAATINSLYADGVIEKQTMSRAFWRRVGDHKARGGISVPDCCCVALAQELQAEVVTSDRAEFSPLVPLGIVPITFIR